MNFPVHVAGDGAGVAAAPEQELETACRIELPGVYFAFNRATIDPASDRSLAAVARILARHPDWRMTVEEHTDSVGRAHANQTLSERRAEAVRARLAERHGVGRARNRRVELVRMCNGRPG